MTAPDVLADVRREARQIVRDGLRLVAPEAVAEVEREERSDRALRRLRARLRGWWHRPPACEVCNGSGWVFAWLPHTPGRRSITRCPACITAEEVGG